MQAKMPTKLKLALEVGPLGAFFLGYMIWGLMAATAAIMVISILSVVLTYYYEKRVSTVALTTAILLTIFGLATLFTGNLTFIKIKPTVINLLFAIILFAGLAANKGLLKHIFGEKIKLHDEAWKIFSRRWACFFVSLALLNEVIWRNFSEDLWVKFKVFGIIGLSLAFMLTQLSFLERNKPK